LRRGGRTPCTNSADRPVGAGLWRRGRTAMRREASSANPAGPAIGDRRDNRGRAGAKNPGTVGATAPPTASPPDVIVSRTAK
jgi:hypothetical protein